MSLDVAESFFYDDATLTAWSNALGDVLARAHETKSSTMTMDFVSRARERTSPRASDHAVSVASS